MLNQYKEAIASLCRLQDEYDKLEIQMSTINRNKRRAKKELSKAETERDSLYDEVKSKLLEQKRSEFSYIQNDIKDMQNKLNKIHERMKEELENIDLSRFNSENQLDSEILVTLGDTFVYLNKKMPDIIGRYEYDYYVCLENMDKLADKCGSDNLCNPVKSKVNILTDMYEDESKSTFEVVLDKIVGAPKGTDFSVKNKVLLYSAYLGIILLAFFNLSFLLLGAIGIGIKAIYDSKKEEKYKNKCIQYLEDFKSMYQIIFKSLEVKKEKYLEDEKKFITSKYFDNIKEFSDKIKEYSKDYEIKIKSVVVSDKEIEREVDKEFSSRLNELKNNLEELDNQSRLILINQNKCEEELDGIQNRICELKDAISKVYWELNEVGNERVLMNEFFLGFKDYDLISVKHDGNAMAIIYDGKSSERNSVLISMFIAQLFSNMLPNVLNLTIVDIDYTCRDYSIYNGGVFDFIFNYVTTEDSISSTIEDIHTDLIKRQSEISPLADTIDDFNKMMIARNSFTREYSFLIFQNAKPDYLKNQKLLQLCRTGQSFGIMPILFISKKLYEDIQRGEENEFKDCQPLVDSLKEYTWKFKQDTLDLERI